MSMIYAVYALSGCDQSLGLTFKYDLGPFQAFVINSIRLPAVQSFLDPSLQYNGVQ